MLRQRLKVEASTANKVTEASRVKHTELGSKVR